MHRPVPEARHPAGASPRGAASRPATASTARRLAGTAAFLLVLAALFAAYLRLSRTYPENSDEANILLMASDLAHGNLLLSGWNVSDVPFITTELPEVALLVRLFGLHLDTAHIAAALTYTVVVALAMLLARGRARGPRAVTRMAVALAILLAPQPGVGVFVLVFSVGHIGTAAPVMLAWLVLDRWPPPPGRTWRRCSWWWPAAVGGLLAWALLADPLVLVIAVVPVLAVCALRVAPGLLSRLQNGSGPSRSRPAFADPGREASLAVAAAAAYLVAWCGGRLLPAAGGYTQQPVPFTLDPAGTWYGHARTVAHGLLAMFGAFPVPGNAINYLGPGDYVAAPPLSGLAEAVAVTRLACVALAAAGAAVVARRFFRRDADLVSQLLLAGVVANLAAYIPSSLADHTALNAREFAPVLPFAAVLAARALGDRLGARAAADRVLAASLAALLGWYCAGLAHQAAAPAAPDPFARLAAFLRQHHLDSGIGGYWNASVITVDTGGAVTVRAVTQGCLQPYAWESRPAWYDPAAGTASFVLESSGPGYFGRWRASPAALRRLGQLLPRAPAPEGTAPGGGVHGARLPGQPPGPVAVAVWLLNRAAGEPAPPCP
jgi:hypothetical protein